MQRTCYALILAAFITISGCHAGDTSKQSKASEPNTFPTEPSQPATPQPTAKLAAAPRNDSRPLLICFGDSLTAGYGTDSGQSYPDFLQADLDAQGYHYRVVNEGVSGATSKDGITRLASIVAQKPAVVIVEFGGNDGLRGLPVKDLRTNLDTIVSTLKATGAKILVAGITLPPDYGPDYVTQFTASYGIVAKKYQVPLLPFLLQGVFGVDGMMQEDRTHATARGNEIVARNVLPLVEPLLKK